MVAVIAACSRRLPGVDGQLTEVAGPPSDRPTAPTAPPDAEATPTRQPIDPTDPTATEAPDVDTDPVSEPPALVPVTAVVLCRDAWGAAPAGPDAKRHVPTRITVHHTASLLKDNREAPERWRGYQRYHQSQGWSDIAYHVGVDRGGNLYELRAADIPGDTFTDYDPAGHHLIVADGNFQDQQPTPEQVEAICQAAAAAAVTYSINPATIGGHRDHASTSCPGDALYDMLLAIRERVIQLVAGGIDGPIVCGPDADARIASIEAGA